MIAPNNTVIQHYLIAESNTAKVDASQNVIYPRGESGPDPQRLGPPRSRSLAKRDAELPYNDSKWCHMLCRYLWQC